jgi:hypothetical protein
MFHGKSFPLRVKSLQVPPYRLIFNAFGAATGRAADGILPTVHLAQ